MGYKSPHAEHPRSITVGYLKYLELIEQQFEDLGRRHGAVYADVGDGAVRRREHGCLWDAKPI